MRSVSHVSCSLMILGWSYVSKEILVRDSLTQNDVDDTYKPHKNVDFIKYILSIQIIKTNYKTKIQNTRNNATFT